MQQQSVPISLERAGCQGLPIWWQVWAGFVTRHSDPPRGGLADVGSRRYIINDVRVGMQRTRMEVIE